MFEEGGRGLSEEGGRGSPGGSDARTWSSEGGAAGPTRRSPLGPDQRSRGAGEAYFGHREAKRMLPPPPLTGQPMPDRRLSHHERFLDMTVSLTGAVTGTVRESPVRAVIGGGARGGCSLSSGRAGGDVVEGWLGGEEEGKEEGKEEGGGGGKGREEEGRRSMMVQGRRISLFTPVPTMSVSPESQVMISSLAEPHRGGEVRIRRSSLTNVPSPSAWGGGGVITTSRRRRGSVSAVDDEKRNTVSTPGKPGQEREKEREERERDGVHKGTPPKGKVRRMSMGGVWNKVTGTRGEERKNNSLENRFAPPSRTLNAQTLNPEPWTPSHKL